MSLAVGQSLSFYEILAPLGAGGMGEVYRARDTRLEREVAIKVLPEHLADDEERLQRFEREAKSLAALSHPNVAQVFGIDRVGDTSFMAMELVPGEDLATLLARGPLPLAEAIAVCLQVAAGLEAAHEAGVIHRDLKPANVRVTSDGTVKLLDFGLAKAAGESEGGALSTEAGRLLGTPAYMAPEQARGKPIDKRVDVWAFGCVLYECLTGRRPFDGETLSDVLAAVLEREPDRSRLPAATPAHVRALIERCLDKDPRRRLRDVGEARIVLERGLEAPRELPAAPRWHGTSRPALGLAAIALVLGGLVGRFGFDRRPARGPSAIQQWSLTEMVGMEETPAVSPDGGKVAFVSRVDGVRQVFVRLLATGSSKQVTFGDIDHSFPRWYSDDLLIYFQVPFEEGGEGSLWETDILASTDPRLLSQQSQGEADVDHARERLATFRNDDEGIALVLADYGGGGRGDVHRLPSAAYCSPRWSPDDEHIAFAATSALMKTELRVFDLDDAEARTVFTVDGMVRGLAWLPDGSGLVYSSSVGSTLPYPPLYRLRTVELDGSGDVLLPCENGGYASYVEPDVTLNGKLVASRVALESDVFRYPVDGTPEENMARELRITIQTGLVQVPSASPDGDEVAYLSDSGGHGNIWIARTDGSGSTRKLTHEQDPRTTIGLPVWSPSGEWITYWRSPPGVVAEQWLIRPNGKDERQLVQARGAATWSRDGEWLYYMAVTGNPGDTSVERVRVDDGHVEFVRKGASCMIVTSDGRTGYFARSDLDEGVIWKASPVDTENPELLCDLQSRLPLWPHMFALSPDDRWLATPLSDHGTTNLWLVPTDGGPLRQVTDFGRRPTMIARLVSWSGKSEHLFAAVMQTDADIVLMDGVLR